MDPLEQQYAADRDAPSVNISTSDPDTDCQTTDCDDSKIQIEAAHHLNNSDGPSLYFGLDHAPLRWCIQWLKRD